MTRHTEYMPPAEQSWYATTARKVRDAIAAVRGRAYTVEQEILLYPTTATSVDYVYARRFVNPAKHRVYAITIETGREFQPAAAEALQITSEVSAGLTEFCLASLCAVEETMAGTALEKEADRLRLFRDREMLKTRAGRRYAQMLSTHSVELLSLIRTDKAFREEVMAGSANDGGVPGRVNAIIESSTRNCWHPSRNSWRRPSTREAQPFSRRLTRSPAICLSSRIERSSMAYERPARKRSFWGRS